MVFVATLEIKVEILPKATPETYPTNERETIALQIGKTTVTKKLCRKSIKNKSNAFCTTEVEISPPARDNEPMKGNNPVIKDEISSTYISAR